MPLLRPPSRVWIRWPWAASAPALPAAPSSAGPAQPPTTKALGDAAEAVALAHLQAAGLVLLARNWRAPGRGGGELDLVMQARDGTLVFVEVRARRSTAHGGAGGSINATKRQRTVRAAQHYLLQAMGSGQHEPPPCRFDVVLVEGELRAPQVHWVQAAFDAEGH